MEILILICLLIVIVLLAKDKIIIRKVARDKQLLPSAHPGISEIMGKPKPLVRHAAPIEATERQLKEQEDIPDNFDPKTKENGFVIEIPLEEPDEVFNNGPDLEEEEAEWRRYGISVEEDGFATGVTFEELSAVGLLLQQDMRERALEEQAVDIVHRIQGTELLSLLENSMEHASKRIADLLDRNMPFRETETGSSTMRNKGFGEFDIGEFV